MSGRSKLLTFGLPVIGLASLAIGTGMVVENRPVNPPEDPPRQPTTAPDMSAPSSQASGDSSGGSQSSDADASRFIGAIGISEPPGEAIAIAAHTPGVVTAVLASVGDEVAAGASLFRIDARAAESVVRSRESQVAVAEADVESLRGQIPPRRAAVASARATKASAEANVAVAQTDRNDRANLLRIAESVDDPRAISAEEVDRRRFALEQADARVRTAEAQVAEADARIAEAVARLAQLESPDTQQPGPELLASIARVEQAQSELDRARTDLDLRTVASPIAGRVLQVNIRPGEFAPASVPTEGLIVLGRSGPDHLRIEIDEVDIPRFNADARAWASPRGDAAERLPLSLAYVEPLVVPKTNLSGRTREIVDTRVLQVVYELPKAFRSPGVGQQFDVYVEAQPIAGSSTRSNSNTGGTGS